VTTAQWVSTVLLVVEYLIKVVAVGVIPENRRPGSSSAWLLLVLFVPALGLPLFLLMGSPYVKGRRHEIQGRANREITDSTSAYPTLPIGIEAPPQLRSIIGLNRRLTAMPCVTGVNSGLHGDYEESIAAMARAVRAAERYVHVEIYIIAWDETTDVFFSALAEAVRRGVTVRLLYDHLGTRKYPGYRMLKRRLTAAGIEWHPMMPIDPLRGRWRRPDLRNHRKLLVVDGQVAFMGSQNMIDSSYLSRGNVRRGRHWHDLNIELSGAVVDSLNAVFAIDWYTETGVRLDPEEHRHPTKESPLDEDRCAFQLVPSGPGFPTEPNLRLFVTLIHQAQRSLSVASPYFIPDESLLSAMTTAAYRGVGVELFVSEKADQFMVHHAQRSYYEALLDAGVRIFLYPAPTVLHAKHFTIDDDLAVIGSSNMDMRSFALDYEISLMGFGGTLVSEVKDIEDQYRAASKELTAAEWKRRPWPTRYLDNVLRLTSALQ
jgi:cardiolipin synthase